MKINYEKKKNIIFLILFLSLIIQSLLVYLDKESNKYIMKEEEFKGSIVWKKYNCQVCHQIYGFGGFLGPDLTNKLKFYDKDQLKNILKSNIKQMPIILMKDEELENLLLFFKYIDKTGLSQIKTKNYKDINFDKIPWFEIQNE